MAAALLFALGGCAANQDDLGTSEGASSATAPDQAENGYFIATLQVADPTTGKRSPVKNTDVTFLYAKTTKTVATGNDGFAYVKFDLTPEAKGAVTFTFPVATAADGTAVTVTSSRSLTRSSSLRQGSGFTVPYLVAEKKDGAWKVVERF